MSQSGGTPAILDYPPLAVEEAVVSRQTILLQGLHQYNLGASIKTGILRTQSDLPRHKSSKIPLLNPSSQTAPPPSPASSNAH